MVEPAAGENFEKTLSKSAPQAKILHKKYFFLVCRKIPPTGGGGRFALGFEKSKSFLQITMGEMNKAPQAKIFVIETIFTPKIAQKCKKIGQQKMYLIWESPPAGGITENSHPLL